MDVRKNHIVLITLILFCTIANSQSNIPQNNSQLLTKKSVFIAGSEIVLSFKIKNEKLPFVFISSSYGETLVKGVLKNAIYTVKLPNEIAIKRGVVLWKLLMEDSSLEGEIRIKSKSEVAKMEAYLGPPSIEAGDRDYSMIVSIPTDSLDNPLADSTKVQIKHQFLNSRQIKEVFTNFMIAYQNIYSPRKAGKIITSTESKGINSKEFEINVMPAIPENFKIFFRRNHNYADGNQITTFYTDQILDAYNNIVSDGTLVEFIITTKEKNLLKANGITVGGIARAQIVHPERQSNWSVFAYVNGMAKSNSIALSFQPALKDFNVVFSKENRTITVGPLQSFLGQFIADGFRVHLKALKNEKIAYSETKTSLNGYITFYINPSALASGTYEFNIISGDIEKKIASKVVK
ncbi:MAG: hypothetical protein JKY02_06610 [Flavobacteriaceae bacterium]|nr:hypothetical protein [Flavobacteriaceae bacterium]